MEPPFHTAAAIGSSCRDIPAAALTPSRTAATVAMHKGSVSGLPQSSLAQKGPAPRTTRIQGDQSDSKIEESCAGSKHDVAGGNMRVQPQPRPVIRPSTHRTDRAEKDSTSSIPRRPPRSSTHKSIERRPASKPIAISARVMERVLEGERAEDEVAQQCNSADEQMYLRLQHARRPVTAPGGELGEPNCAPPQPRTGGMMTRKRSSAEMIFMMDGLDV